MKIGSKDFDDKILVFLTTEQLRITDKGTTLDTESGCSQDVTVQDQDGNDHFFTLGMHDGKYFFLCDSYESDDGSEWGIRED